MALNLNEITNVITTQPTSDQELKPCNARWNTDFLESCSPITDGIIYCCCGCICEGLLHARTGEHFCSCLLPCSTQSLRTKIRMAYGIKGSLLGDYLASCLCFCPCNLLQMKKELDQQNVPDPYANTE
ncbi:unnamed protein product [Rotaria magnacalcarata]|uniref:Uncharacterized protein n=1 Tax=Rotaria magnacalcarata TaxID=392030 RepID=A0A816KIB0_9BILA|nr:unnamed protein product [Rotaria magnacalcarata]